MASPGSRKARCMSTTSRALLPGARVSADSKAEVRSTTYSALDDASSGLPGPCRFRSTYSALGSPSAALRETTCVSVTFRGDRLICTVLEPFTQLSARLRLASNYHAP